MAKRQVVGVSQLQHLRDIEGGKAAAPARASIEICMSAIVFLLPIPTRPFASYAIWLAVQRRKLRLRPKCTVEFLNSGTWSKFASTPGALDVMRLTFECSSLAL